MNLQEILSHLDGVKPQSDGSYIALCPCHDDHRPSLDIMEGQKGIVMTCPVCGADGKTVMDALNLDVKELFFEQKSAVTRPEQVTYYYSENLKKTRFYVWDNTSQSYHKAFCWYHKGDKGQQVKGLPKDENGRSLPVPLYKQGSVFQARERGETLYIAEGEKDVDTLTNDLGLLAVCSPHGAGRGKLEKKWCREYNEMFKGVSVAIIPDNDDPGRELANYIAEQIEPFADEVKALDLTKEWTDLKHKGDITDVYEKEKPSQNESKEEAVRFKLKALTMTTEVYLKAPPLAGELAERPSGALTEGAEQEQAPCSQKQTRAGGNEAPSVSKADTSPKAKALGEALKNEPKYICLDDVESTTTEWLWYPYIPQGKITLMTADPGTGKTFLSLYLAAQVSTGRPFYGETRAYCEPANVVYQTAEDGIADTIKPRLEPMRPNFSKIFILDETDKTLNLSDDRVEQIMKDLKPKLLIFDPLQAYLGAKIDMNRANEVRPVLQRLHNLAEKYNVAVILIMHHSKSSQNAALHRALGSMDIPAVARSMLILGKDPKNPFGRILCHEKSSLEMRGRSICFEVNPKQGGIKFNCFCDETADDILNFKQTERNKPSVKKDELCDKILEMFGEENEIEIKDMNEICERFECSTSTLYRARKELDIKHKYKGFGNERVVVWSLPE